MRKYARGGGEEGEEARAGADRRGSPGKGWRMARMGLGRVKGRSRWAAMAAWCPPSQKTIGDVWTPGLGGCMWRYHVWGTLRQGIGFFPHLSLPVTWTVWTPSLGTSFSLDIKTRVHTVS